MRRIARLVVRALRRVGLLRDGDLQAARHTAVLAAVTRLNLPRDACVLDVGCGTGRLLEGLRSEGFADLHGCDWMEPGPQVGEYRSIDLNEQSLADTYGAGFADLVICSDVIEHIERPAKLLREIAGVLSTGGYVVITLPNAANVFERGFFALTGNLYRYQPARFGPHGHISVLPRWVMDYLLGQAGLRTDRVDGDLVAFAGAVVPWLPATTRWSYSIVMTLSGADGRGE